MFHTLGMEYEYLLSVFFLKYMLIETSLSLFEDFYRLTLIFYWQVLLVDRFFLFLILKSEFLRFGRELVLVLLFEGTEI